MRPFVHALRMIHALPAYHDHDAGELLAAIFADVFFLLATFIELVATFMGTVRMTRTSAGSKGTNIRETVAAILTIIILLFHGIHSI